MRGLLGRPVVEGDCAAKGVLERDLSARVLLADEDDDARRAIAQALRQDGHVVIEVCSGAELLDFLALSVVNSRLFDYPDVIVSAVRMPGFSGLDILTALRLAQWALPFVVMTELGDATARQTAKRLAAAAVFEKPCDLGELRRVVMSLTCDATGTHARLE